MGTCDDSPPKKANHRPRSEGVTSPVCEMSQDPRRQNAPKAENRPRSQRKVRTGDRKVADLRRNGRGPGTLVWGPATTAPQKRPITVPGQRELRPWSVGVASLVREMCRDPRRQNAPKADYRPRSEGVTSQVREMCRDLRRQSPKKGRLPSPVPEKSADLRRKGHGPGTLVWDRG